MTVSKISWSSSATNQYLATIIANLTNILYGYSSGWSSSSLLVLESNDTSPLIQGELNQEERSWVTSLFAISGVAGTVIYYLIANSAGRKIPLWSVGIPHIISWVLIEIGVYPWQLYLARVLSGMACGGSFTLVPLFVAEISESHVRGRLGSLLMLSANSGFLFAFLAGHYMTYHTIPFVGIAISILFLATFLRFPETPVFLLRQKNEQMAEQSFRFYRNVSANEPMPIEVNEHWQELKKNVEETLKTQHTQSDYKDLFRTRSGRKAFIIGVALILLHELCGCFTMLNFTAKIFVESGSKISANFSAIIVGLIQLLGTYVATFLVDRLGRKILLTFSAIGTAICLTLLGAYSYCNKIGLNVEDYSWISIASFSGMMFTAACGIIPLMFVVIAEVMPEKVRSIGCTICFCLSWILAFVMVKFFEAVAAEIGMHGWVFFFAGCTICGAVFIITFIPETKGKTYAEIAAILER